MKKLKANKISMVILLIFSVICIIFLSYEFKKLSNEEVIYTGVGVTEIKKLSDYYQELENTPGDTEVYVLRGETAGPSMLVLGGTHPNEPAGLLTAVTLIENAKLSSGTLYIIPRSNNSAYTHTDPQEGAPMKFTINTNNGDRWFRFGSRATNPVHQWPDPEIYVHKTSGQKLSGSETRNLNRAYPGRTDGNFTEKIAHGITELIKSEVIDITIDLHEASPEYPTINAIVSHEDSMPLSSLSMINMQIQGIEISLEPSPKNLHGLSHRELGDFTDTLAILMETANPSQGRLRGKTNENLVVNGTDKYYTSAARYGRLYVPFTESGHPIYERVARHITGVLEIANAYNDISEKKIIIENIPDYNEIIDDELRTLLEHKQ